MNQELLKEYAKVCTTLKDLETRKKELQPLMYEHLNSLDLDKIQSPFGTFSLGERKSYTYTDEVAMAKEEIKAIQTEEENNGKAQIKITPFVRYQANKE